MVTQVCVLKQNALIHAESAVYTVSVFLFIVCCQHRVAFCVSQNSPVCPRLTPRRPAPSSFPPRLPVSAAQQSPVPFLRQSRAVLAPGPCSLQTEVPRLGREQHCAVSRTRPPGLRRVEDSSPRPSSDARRLSCRPPLPLGIAPFVPSCKRALSLSSACKPLMCRDFCLIRICIFYRAQDDSVHFLLFNKMSNQYM